jgi:uncharacterized metal-binding protein
MEEIKRSCIDCSVKSCGGSEKGYPDFCLTTHMDEERKQEALACYEADPEIKRIMRNAAQVEYEFYCKMTRVEETVEFCKRMGYKKIGIATCVGLLQEAGIFAKILRKNGFEVFGIGCKAGAVPKVSVGIPTECEAVGKNMCNPILQAKTLNEEHTELNVVIGLCVGHDSLFYKYSEAPVTTLVVKDRVLGHNPVAALYQTKAYYSRLLAD